MKLKSECSTWNLSAEFQRDFVRFLARLDYKQLIEIEVGIVGLKALVSKAIAEKCPNDYKHEKRMKDFFITAARQQRKYEDKLQKILRTGNVTWKSLMEEPLTEQNLDAFPSSEALMLLLAKDRIEDFLEKELKKKKV